MGRRWPPNILQAPFPPDWRFGDAWPQHFLPVATVQNALWVAGHGIIASCGFPEDVPRHDEHRMEDSIEMFFSDIKRHTRGTPALKDLVYGIHLKHLEELRTEHKSKKDPRFATPVAPERANEMSKLCLRYAVILVGFCEPGRTREGIFGEFKDWFETKGRRLLSMSGGDDPEHDVGFEHFGAHGPDFFEEGDSDNTEGDVQFDPALRLADRATLVEKLEAATAKVEGEVTLTEAEEKDIANDCARPAAGPEAEEPLTPEQHKEVKSIAEQVPEAAAAVGSKEKADAHRGPIQTLQDIIVAYKKAGHPLPDGKGFENEDAIQRF